MLNKVKQKRSTIVFLTIFLVGFCLTCYPFVASLFMSHDQSSIVQTYSDDVESMDKDQRQDIIAKAQEYNSLLYQTNGAIVGNSSEILSHENYMNLLNVSDNDIMATLEIPKINVDLPIYHGTEDEVLSIGVGHLEGSSLPVGGESTRCILTGHRGLPSSKLFTRLDEIVEGDLFYIDVLGETMAYEVNEVEVIDPDEVDKLEIEPDKDLVTLITCTPYGINTHRLVVTGERVPYKEKVKDSIQSNIPSIRELLFMVLPFLFLAILISMIIRQHRKEKRNEA